MSDLTVGPLEPEPRAGAARVTDRIESRSIDYIPEAERHGRPWHLGPVWFMSNAQLGTIAIGVIGVAVGGNILWTFLATIIGVLIGTVFMAFHSVQGPRLGLPQMIQSRAQFGYLGAILPLLIVIILTVGFTIFNVIITGQALAVALHISTAVTTVFVALVALLIALFGYDAIHRAQQISTYLFLIGFILFTAGVLISQHPHGAPTSTGFSAVPFFVTVGIFAAYQVGLALYVADYSRYLPRDTSSKAVFMWTYFPVALSTIWLGGLGTFLAALNIKLGTVPAIFRAGQDTFTGLGTIGLLAAVPGTITISAMNNYTGALDMTTVLNTVFRQRPTRALRVLLVVLIGVFTYIMSKVLSNAVLDHLDSYLTFLLYPVVPWTAVNLTDFFFVRRGSYGIRELYNPHGMYGRVGWRGLCAYVLGFAAMIPFVNTSGVYTGPVSNAMSGVDVAMFVGLPVAAVAYLLLSRGVDVDRERRIAAETDRDLPDAVAWPEGAAVTTAEVAPDA